MAVALSAVHYKNLLLVVAAAAAIAQDQVDDGHDHGVLPPHPVASRREAHRGRDQRADRMRAVTVHAAQRSAVADRMVDIAGGRFWMGSDGFYPEEGPVREVEVQVFAIDRGPLTAARFERVSRTAAM